MQSAQRVYLNFSLLVRLKPPLSILVAIRPNHCASGKWHHGLGVFQLYVQGWSMPIKKISGDCSQFSNFSVLFISFNIILFENYYKYIIIVVLPNYLLSQTLFFLTTLLLQMFFGGQGQEHLWDKKKPNSAFAENDSSPFWEMSLITQNFSQKQQYTILFGFLWYSRSQDECSIAD